jgi:hypothetical protein
MMNFSPFFVVSGGLVTPAGFGLSFSDAGVAAQRVPYSQKMVIENAIIKKSDLLNFILIAPPRNIYLKDPHPRLRLEMNRLSIRNQF